MELIKRLTKFAQGTAITLPGMGRQNAFVLAPLRKLGWAVPFQPTAAAVKVYQAVIADKVALIDRLPSKYRKDAKQVVWDYVMKGYDVAGLARELNDRFGIVAQRAQLVASMQCKMARSVIENAQRIELGIVEAIWSHDSEKCTIPSHKAFDGKRYALARGAVFDGKRVWPSSEPECFCTSTAIDGAEAEGHS
jgi:uncharacterized protein with gpF-like domain